MNQPEMSNALRCSHISADSLRDMKFYIFKQSVTHKQTLEALEATQDGGRRTAGSSGGIGLEIMLH